MFKVADEKRTEAVGRFFNIKDFILPQKISKAPKNILLHNKWHTEDKHLDYEHTTLKDS